MPELPEVETLRRGLEKTILGKRIKSVEVRLPKIVSIGPAVVSNVRKTSKKVAGEFIRLLIGHKFVRVSGRAKMLILDLSPGLSPSPACPSGRRGERNRSAHPSPGDGEGLRDRSKLLIHLKMTGQLIYAKKNEKKAVKLFNIPNSKEFSLPHK